MELTLRPEVGEAIFLFTDVFGFFFGEYLHLFSSRLGAILLDVGSVVVEFLFFGNRHKKIQNSL
jgi:hypothetical protein